MDLNLTGKLWGMPYNLTGQVTDQSQVISQSNVTLSPTLADNLTGPNFYFSGQATANLTQLSIVAAIGISIIIFPIIIAYIINITQRNSKELFNEYSYTQEGLNAYSRLCGQITLSDYYIRSYLHYSNIDNPERSEDLLEKMVLSNKDLLELIVLTQQLFKFKLKFTYLISAVREINDKAKNKSLSEADIDNLDKSIERLLVEIKTKIDEQNEKDSEDKQGYEFRK